MLVATRATKKPLAAAAIHHWPRAENPAGMIASTMKAAVVGISRMSA